MKYNFDNFIYNFFNAGDTETATKKLEKYGYLEMADMLLNILEKAHLVSPKIELNGRTINPTDLLTINLASGEDTSAADFTAKRKIIRNYQFLAHPDKKDFIAIELKLSTAEKAQLNNISSEISSFINSLVTGSLNFKTVETFNILKAAFEQTIAAKPDASSTVDKLLEELSKATTTGEKSTILFRNKQYFKDLSAQQQRDIAPDVGETISSELISALTDIQAKNIACIKATNIELSRR